MLVRERNVREGRGTYARDLRMSSRRTSHISNSRRECRIQPVIDPAVTPPRRLASAGARRAPCRCGPPPQKKRSPPSDSRPDTPFAGRHIEPLQHFAGLRIDPPHVALVTFPGAVPELAVDPGDAGDEAFGLDGAKDGPGLRIDLMDLAVPVLSHPQRPLGPGEPGVTAAAGRGDRGEHTAARRIDLLDAILGDLKQMLAVEGRSGMRGDLDRRAASCRSPDRRRSVCRRRRTRPAGHHR